VHQIRVQPGLRPDIAGSLQCSPNFYYVVSETSNVGGVGIYVKNTFVVHELDHLQIPSTAENAV